MDFNDIYKFYSDRPRTYLVAEQAVCYVLSILLEGESYGTELVNRIKIDTQQWDISDTVLYQVIYFLINEGWIESERVKVEGRGRPRRMLKLLPEYRAQAEEFAKLWLAEAGTKPAYVQQPIQQPVSSEDSDSDDMLFNSKVL